MCPLHSATMTGLSPYINQNLSNTVMTEKSAASERPPTSTTTRYLLLTFISLSGSSHTLNNPWLSCTNLVPDSAFFPSVASPLTSPLKRGSRQYFRNSSTEYWSNTFFPECLNASMSSDGNSAAMSECEL